MIAFRLLNIANNRYNTRFKEGLIGQKRKFKVSGKIDYRPLYDPKYKPSSPSKKGNKFNVGVYNQLSHEEVNLLRARAKEAKLAKRLDIANKLLKQIKKNEKTGTFNYGDKDKTPRGRPSPTSSALEVINFEKTSTNTGVASYRFRNGGKVYSTPFTQKQFDAWMTSPSIGRYFLNHIKGQFAKAGGKTAQKTAKAVSKMSGMKNVKYDYYGKIRGTDMDYKNLKKKFMKK